MTIMFQAAFSYDWPVIVIVFPYFSEDNKGRVCAQVNTETAIATAWLWDCNSGCWF